MDSLAGFFAHFTLSARVFYSGTLCGVSGDHASEFAGHLHILRSGSLQVIPIKGRARTIDQPSVIFYPRPLRHRFRTSPDDGADLVCALIEFGSGLLNPLVKALPDVLVVPLGSMPALEPAVDLLFEEAFADRPGRQAAVDRLTEYFVVLLLRAAMNARLMRAGVLNGLADARISRAMEAMHQRPEHTWTLEELAEAAGMSRARLSVNFRKIVGITPFEYLAEWRIGIAQTMLKQGEPLKTVAPAVGYASSAALNRAFLKLVGITPTAWLLRAR
jgi:AraC-like DNA-binding protein